MAASEQGTGARRDVVLDFFGVGGGPGPGRRYAKVKLSEAQSSVSKVPGTDNDLYHVKIGKTRLSWNGRAVGDSTRVEQPIQESWLAKGTSGTVWRVDTTFKPGMESAAGRRAERGREGRSRQGPQGLSHPLCWAPLSRRGRRAALFPLSRPTSSRSTLLQPQLGLLPSHPPSHLLLSPSTFSPPTLSPR